MCAVVELDPLFLKALGYFRSKLTDAPDKLKDLLDDSFNHPKRLQDSKDSDKPPSSFVKSVKPAVKQPNAVNLESKKEKDLAQKRQFDKIQRDLDEINQETSKKLYKASMSPNGTSSSSCGSRPSSKHGSPIHEIIDQNHGSYGKQSRLPVPADDFELEMEGLACAICKQISMGSRNQLVECQECHNLYHQDCHQPPVSDQDSSDPRCIWYCARCKKNMKKLVKQHVAKPLSFAAGNPAGRHRDKSPMADTKNSLGTPFKRHEMKTNLGSVSGGSSMQGWAALSGKSVSTHPKHQEEQTKHLESKLDASNHKSLKSKILPKLHKNHTKPTSKFSVSDAWAEALGAKAPKTDSKMSAQKTNISNSTKHNSATSLPRTANALDSTSAKTQHVSQNFLNSNAHTTDRAAPYPKASAAMSADPRNSNNRNSAQNQENAAKRLQLVKKKAAAQMQQKRSRI